MLFVSATVYDRQFSALRWSDEHGSHRALSNIDFNYLVGVGGFETADTCYTLILGLTNESRAETKSDLPLDVTAFSPTRSEYAILEDATHSAPIDEDLTALDALHVFFDANKPRLIAESAKREAAREERERWLKEHPPARRDTVINYWIGEGAGTVILNNPTMGGRP